MAIPPAEIAGCSKQLKALRTSFPNGVLYFVHTRQKGREWPRIWAHKKANFRVGVTALMVF